MALGPIGVNVLASKNKAPLPNDPTINVLESYFSTPPLETPESFKTNACHFNRLYITNCLIFKTSRPSKPDDIIIIESFTYIIKKLSNKFEFVT